MHSGYDWPLTHLTSPKAAIRAAVGVMHLAGVTTIILLSHLGLYQDRGIAQSVSGLSVIVGGHTHILLSNTDPHVAGPCPVVETSPAKQPVLIVNAGCYGDYLGVLDVTLDEQGAALSWSGNPVKLDETVPADPATAAEVALL